MPNYNPQRRRRFDARAKNEIQQALASGDGLGVDKWHVYASGRARGVRKQLACMADSILRSEGCMPLTFPDYQEVAPAIGMLAVPEVLENTNASPVCTSVTDMLE